MRLVALADEREDFGLPTDAGATVGEVTLGGTLAVLLVGVLLGVLGAFVYLALRRWLPAAPVHRTLVFALLILGLGLGQTIRGNEGDFVFLDPVVSILSFSALLVLYAVVVPPLIDRFAPRTTGRSTRGRGLVAAIVIVALVFGALPVEHVSDVTAAMRSISSVSL